MDILVRKPFPAIDMKELDEDKAANQEQRMAFVRFYAAYVKLKRKPKTHKGIVALWKKVAPEMIRGKKQA